MEKDCTLDTRSTRFGRHSYSDVWKSVELPANTQWLDQSRIPYSRSKLIPLVRPGIELGTHDLRERSPHRR